MSDQVACPRERTGVSNNAGGNTPQALERQGVPSHTVTAELPTPVLLTKAYEQGKGEILLSMHQTGGSKREPVVTDATPVPTSDVDLPPSRVVGRTRDRSHRGTRRPQSLGDHLRDGGSPGRSNVRPSHLPEAHPAPPPHHTPPPVICCSPEARWFVPSLQGRATPAT